MFLKAFKDVWRKQLLNEELNSILKKKKLFSKKINFSYKEITLYLEINKIEEEKIEFKTF